MRLLEPLNVGIVDDDVSKNEVIMDLLDDVLIKAIFMISN